jgi:hypothetical protein
MKTISETLKKFKSLTIEHPQFKHAVDAIMDSIESTAEMDDSGSAMLLGQAGTGKSRVCHRLQELLGPARDEEREGGFVHIIPCLYCPVPGNATTHKLSLTMLYKLGFRSNVRDNGILLYSVVTLLKTCETKLVIIDEFQQLAEKGADKTKSIMCDWVKTLLNEAGITCLLAGTPAFEAIVDDNAQLSQRYPHRVRLNNFSYGCTGFGPEPEWPKILGKFTTEMIKLGGLTRYVFLSDSYFALATYVFTRGNMRGLRLLLHAAFRRCLIRGDHELTREDFIRAADDVVFKDRIRPDINPFSVTAADLDKIMKKIS